MENVMTIAEIESRYDAEWILVEDPRTDEQLRIEGGTVIAHSKDRDEVYRYAVSAKPKRFAVIYTGSIPQDAAIVL